jgi:hypothetical protein
MAAMHPSDTGADFGGVTMQETPASTGQLVRPTVEVT